MYKPTPQLHQRLLFSAKSSSHVVLVVLFEKLLVPRGADFGKFYMGFQSFVVITFLPYKASLITIPYVEGKCNYQEL
jgi:hypothetical protein